MARVPSLTDIRRWDPGRLIQASSQWASTAASWQSTFTSLSNQIADPAGHQWDGAAADRARRLADTDRLYAIAAADRLDAAAGIARAGADRIGEARRAVLQIVDSARSAGFDVGEDFAVSARNGRRDQALALTRDLDSRLGRLLLIDRDIAAEITKATGELGRDVPTRSADHEIKQSPPQIPTPDDTAPLPDDPKRFNELWTGLTPDEQDQLFRQDDSIGNHGGMPFTDRDSYNRIRLDRLRTASQAEVDGLQGRFDELAAQVYMGDHSSETTSEMHSVAADLAGARHRLDGYEAVREALASDDGVPRLLGLIDDHGHAAISIGDPDTATRTATFVPGTGQDMATLDDGSRRGWDMFQAALDANPALSKNELSVTTWAGYDRPMTLTEAAWPDRARRGGAALDSYLDGMHASHCGPAAVDTVIGHSYGSTLVGAAATGGHHLAADNVIAVGSPGMLSRHAGDLALDPGARVYSMTAEHDPISLVTSLTLGADPNAADYGATRLATNSGSPLPYSAGLLPGVSAHSSYWDEGNPGLANIGAIIAGLPPTSAVR
ncbi:MAG: alpha/beta hydrolase [Mycobacterium sp.]